MTTNLTIKVYQIGAWQSLFKTLSLNLKDGQIDRSTHCGQFQLWKYPDHPALAK